MLTLLREEVSRSHDRALGIMDFRYAPIALRDTETWLTKLQVLARSHGVKKIELLIGVPPRGWLSQCVTSYNYVEGPGRAGIGFLTQLAVALQADAFLGAADVYGICSTLTGVPTTLLAEDTRPAAVALLEECPHVRRALAHAPLADELAMLLDRADATVDNASAPATGEFVSA